MLWDEPYEEHGREAERILASDIETAFLLFDDQNQAVGFIEGAIYQGGDQKYGHVEGWFVHPDRRRQGYGGQLLNALEQWILHRSIDLVLSDTVPAQYHLSPGAHKRNGFKELMTIQVFIKETNKEPPE